MNLNLSQFDPAQIYHLMTQTVIPRPIAWVLTKNTVDSDSTDCGQYNLAPFSYFNAVCSQPPLLMISVGKKPSGDKKDTTVNLSLGAKCVVHIASTDHAVDVTATAATLNYGDSELTHTKLNLVEQTDFELPRLALSPIAFNCEVYETKEIGDAPQQLIFLQILSIYVDDNCVDTDAKGRIAVSAAAVDPLARLGANQYSGISGVLDIVRPK